jgi:hypothetical protein
MIPLSMKNEITYKDKDGNTWIFRPKTGEREYAFYKMCDDDNSEGRKVEDIFKRHDDFVDDVLISTTAGDFQGKKPSQIFIQEEKAEILKMWNDANKLTVEEKKS